MSSVSVKETIRKMVGAEDSRKPLTDQQLVAMLQAKNIDIARRTVAKYRQELDIPSTSAADVCFNAGARPCPLSRSHQGIMPTPVVAIVGRPNVASPLCLTASSAATLPWWTRPPGLRGIAIMGPPTGLGVHFG